MGRKREGNGVPTPFLRIASKRFGSCFTMVIFWMRSHTFFVSTTSLVLTAAVPCFVEARRATTGIQSYAALSPLRE